MVAYLALFIALGGTAAALQGKRSVKSDDLATGSVGTRALARGAVDSGDIRGQAVEARNIERQAIGLNKLKLQSVTSQTVRNRTLRSEDFSELLELPLATNQAIIGEGSSMRILAPVLRWAPTRDGQSVFRLQSEPGGGGGLVLNGSAGPLSGYLRLIESTGPPPGSSDAVSLFARDDGFGKTELVAVFPGGTTEVLAPTP